jgi:hypothetical protein
MYDAVYAVIDQYYHPKPNIDDLEARRELNECLAKLSPVLL